MGWKRRKLWHSEFSQMFTKCFLTSRYKCKWASWWCHRLTTCDEKFNILCILVIVCPSYQAVLELTLFYIYSERNWGKSNILIAEIWNFCHFCAQNEWEIVRRWHHQLAHLHIHTNWSRNVSWKFVKLQSVITFLFFNWFSSGFHYFIHKSLLFLMKLS